MTDIQTMTLVVPTETASGRTLPEDVRMMLEADGFTVQSVDFTPPPRGAPTLCRYIRAIATYPTAWLLGGWRKGSA